MVAEHKAIAAQKLEARVRRRSVHEPSHTFFDLHIDIGAGLTKRERVILFNSARRCDVHKPLAGKLNFNYTLAESWHPGGDTVDGRAPAPTTFLMIGRVSERRATSTKPARRNDDASPV